MSRHYIECRHYPLHTLAIILMQCYNTGNFIKTTMIFNLTSFILLCTHYCNSKNSSWTAPAKRRIRKAEAITQQERNKCTACKNALGRVQGVSKAWKCRNSEQGSAEKGAAGERRPAEGERSGRGGVKRAGDNNKWSANSRRSSVRLPGYCHKVGVARAELCAPHIGQLPNPAALSSAHCSIAPPPWTPPAVAAMPASAQTRIWHQHRVRGELAPTERCHSETIHSDSASICRRIHRVSNANYLRVSFVQMPINLIAHCFQ